MEHEGALRKLRQEAEDQLLRAERERDELQDELRSLQHDRDQSLLQAETEKQQVWSWCMMYEEGLNHRWFYLKRGKSNYLTWFYKPAFIRPLKSKKNPRSAILDSEYRLCGSTLLHLLRVPLFVNPTFPLFPGSISEGGRENSFVWQGVLPAGWAVSCSPGGRADVERSSPLQRAGAGDVTSSFEFMFWYLLVLSYTNIWGSVTNGLSVFTQIRVEALSSELLELRSHLEDAASVHERELHSLQETCADLQSRADVTLKEVDETVKFKTENTNTPL